MLKIQMEPRAAGEWFHCHVWKSIDQGKLLLISLMYTVFTATVNYR